MCRWRWRKVEHAHPTLNSAGAGLGPAWRPIVGALKAKDTTDRGPAQKGALRSLVANRQWPQQRLHAAGLADSSLCKLCIDMSGGAQPGTLLHRHRCPALAVFRSQYMPSWFDSFLRMQEHQLSSSMHLAHDKRALS